MTRIITQHTGKGLRLTIDGHTEYGEYGKSILCAAVSTLGQTLGYTVERYNAAKRLKSCTVEKSDGHIHIYAEPNDDAKLELATAFDTVLLGLIVLARQYPKHIKLEGKPPRTIDKTKTTRKDGG